VKASNAVVVLGVALCVALSGCSQNAVASHDAPQQRRIVTLMPSFAEDLIAIGAQRQLVGVSAFTDMPEAKNLPKVADFVSVDAEKIVALHADLVVATPSQSRLVEPLRRAGVTVLTLTDDGYDDIFSVIRSLGDATGRRPQADALVAQLQRETASLHATTRTFVRHPHVFVALGSSPIWTAGTRSYVGTLIGLAGGINAADIASPWGEYSPEALLRAQPDLIVTGTDAHLYTVLNREPWRSLHAVQAHHVYVLQDVALLYRPGPNYNEGLRWLIERLKPLST
jgi:iron complex transport system substrate-binding protein